MRGLGEYTHWQKSVTFQSHTSHKLHFRTPKNAVIDREGVNLFVETLVIPSGEHVERIETLTYTLAKTNSW